MARKSTAFTLFSVLLIGYQREGCDNLVGDNTNKGGLFPNRTSTGGLEFLVGEPAMARSGNTNKGRNYPCIRFICTII